MSGIPDEFMKAAEASLSIQPSRVAFPRSDVVLLMARALLAADEAATKRASQWQPIETAPEGQAVLATYQNSHKKWRTIKAVRYDKFSREITSADDLEQDYDEENDGYYWTPGWYEIIENWDDYTHIVVNFAPTHWMPLPVPPAILKGEA